MYSKCKEDVVSLLRWSALEFYLFSFCMKIDMYNDIVFGARFLIHFFYIRTHGLCFVFCLC
jgi:hypothetical protein